MTERPQSHSHGSITTEEMAMADQDGMHPEIKACFAILWTCVLFITSTASDMSAFGKLAFSREKDLLNNVQHGIG